MPLNYCSVDGCSSKVGSGVSFFRCPKDERCQSWRQVLGFTGNHRYAKIAPEQCYTRIKICSLHFTDESFRNDNKIHIIYSAIPSLKLPASKDDVPNACGLSKCSNHVSVQTQNNVSVQTQTDSDLEEDDYFEEEYVEGEEVKKKWKNMRDTYSKHIKSAATTTNQGSKKNNTEWQWSRQMEFLKPFLACSKTIPNPNNPNDPFEEIKDIKEEIIINESLFSDDSHSSNTAQPPLTDIEPSTPSNQIKKKTISKDSPVDRVIEFLSNRRLPVAPELDALEHLFMGFAKTVKTFSPKRQALAKMKIAQIVSEQELQHLDELASQQCSFLPPPAPSESNGVVCDENIDYEDMKVSPRGSPVPMDDYRLHEDDYLDTNIKPDVY